MSAEAPGARIEQPIDVRLRIDRLVVETPGPVDTFSLQRALGDAVRAVIVERGVPATWVRDSWTPVATIDDFAWDGRGGEQGLARVLAARLYDSSLAPECRP